MAQLRAERDAALEGELSDSSGEVDELEDDDDEADERERRKADRRHAKAMAKAEAAAARLRLLEDAARPPRAGSGASSEDDDAMWDYMDVDMALPQRLADLDAPPGR